MPASFFHFGHPSNFPLLLNVKWSLKSNMNCSSNMPKMLRVFDKFCHKLKMDTFTYMYKHTHTNSSNNIPPSQVAGGIT